METIAKFRGSRNRQLIAMYEKRKMQRDMLMMATAMDAIEKDSKRMRRQYQAMEMAYNALLKTQGGNASTAATTAANVPVVVDNAPSLTNAPAATTVNIASGVEYASNNNHDNNNNNGGNENNKGDRACIRAVDVETLCKSRGISNEIGLLLTSDTNSLNKCEKFMEWLIYPTKMETFFTKHWESQPLYIQRHDKDPNFYNGWFLLDDIWNCIERHPLQYGKYVDVVRCDKRTGMREENVVDAHGLAAVDQVKHWFNSNQCSVRLKHPQEFVDTVWLMVSLIQDFFGCIAGSNVYLTPKSSQGFAPHYDDVDVYILQLEGSKIWHLFEPLNDGSSVLPRFSSEDIQRSTLGKPKATITLKKGDLLYLPRGTIHQAECPPNEFSLHLTLSTGQKNTWLDFMDKVLTNAMESAWDDCLDFRKSLPVNHLSFMGAAFATDKQDSSSNDNNNSNNNNNSKNNNNNDHNKNNNKSNNNKGKNSKNKKRNDDDDDDDDDGDDDGEGEEMNEDRKAFVGTFNNLFEKICSYVNLDAAADLQGIDFMHGSLPPVLSPNDLRHTGAIMKMDGRKNPSKQNSSLTLDSEIRLVVANALRLAVSETGHALCYYNTQNHRVYMAEDPYILTFDEEYILAVDQIIHAYPSHIKVKTLLQLSEEKQMLLATALFKKAIICVK